MMNTSKINVRCILLALALGVSSARSIDAQTAAPADGAKTEEKAPAGVDPKLSSDDPEYGYSREKPIKVGPRSLGSAAQGTYLRTLRDEAGEPVKFKRVGSFGTGPYGNVLDGFEVTTSTGRKVLLYIDMYHEDSDPRKQPAPHGLFKAK